MVLKGIFLPVIEKGCIKTMVFIEGTHILELDRYCDRELFHHEDCFFIERPCLVSLPVIYKSCQDIVGWLFSRMVSGFLGVHAIRDNAQI